MARRAASKDYDPHDHLFAEVQDRRRRKLVLPRLLAQAAQDRRLDVPERDAAYEVVTKWAKMAEAGQLRRNETSVDDAFLAEVFGQALGYHGVTESPERYERERQFHVPGVGLADGVLGKFPPADQSNVIAVIELKGSSVDLDRDKSNGRTAVQQVWDYLNAMPETCRWGIVSNFTTIRLYHRDRGSQTYEQFTLREMASHRERFDQFYALFEVGGLLRGVLKQPPRAIELIERTQNQQREVGDKLYDYYSHNRLKLIHHLSQDLGMPLEEAIRLAQKLLDRIIFVAFCEDRDILPPNLLKRAYEEKPFLTKVRNPVWQNFLAMFHAVDKGHPEIGIENGYNGGLFRHDPALDELQLEDEPWASFFHRIGSYDYRDEIDVDVLGHLFEKSVTELERLRIGGLFGDAVDETAAPLMPKSPQRKLVGVYYTPLDFTTAIAEFTIGDAVERRCKRAADRLDLTAKQINKPRPAKAVADYWRACLDELKNLKVVDPACGSGAFLIQAFETLFHHYSIVLNELAHFDNSADDLLNDVPDWILTRNLYGVDLQPEAVEIAQLALWLRTARPGRTLADLSQNIVCGNSLVDDPTIHPAAMDWRETFPDVFDRDEPGFDCVIGNPPWERMKLQEREFFTFSAPHIATAVNAAQRRKLIKELEREGPELYQRYREAADTASRTLDYIRKSKRFPLTGKGDINTYAVFAELARQIVAPQGYVGLLVPSGIASDKTTAKFFNKLSDDKALIRLYDFENKKPFFADVHRSFKFSILNFGGSAVRCEKADFVFFAHDLRELQQKQRRIELSAADLKRLNPNTRTCPIFRTRRDAQITKAIYERVPVLIDRTRKQGGNPWGVRFLTMFHQTNDAELFTTPQTLEKKQYRLEGNQWVRGSKRYLPLYEAKMIQAYDHRAASVEVVKGNWFRQGQTVRTTLVDHQNPEYVAMPRWWATKETITDHLPNPAPPALLAFKNVTSPTNTRTMIAAMIPCTGVVNSAPLMFTGSDISPRRQACLLGNLNAFALDFVARQKVGNVNLNFFIIEQLPMFPPDAYAEACPWAPQQTLEEWISDRVLKLTCTADDMIPLAEACGMDPPVHKWKPQDRQQLLAELDAAYFHLYGLTRDDAIYILTTFRSLRPDEESTTPLNDAGMMIVNAFDKLAEAAAEPTAADV